MNNKRLCPLCAGNKSKLLHKQKFANYFNHEIAICFNCSFVFVRSIPPISFYITYYTSASKYEGVRQHETHNDATKKFLKPFISKNISKKASILDVGCSTGYILGFLKRLGYKNLHGLDPAPECKRIIKEKYNISINTSDLEGFKTKKKYRFIILSQVLEHIVGINQAIDKLYSLVEDKGYIFMGVPGIDGFSEELEEPFGEFSTEHINFFSLGSLSYAMRRFTLVDSLYKKNVLLTLWKKQLPDLVAISNYIEKSEHKLNKIKKLIDTIPDKLLVWGAGSLTQRLLETTDISKKVVKFIDSDKKLWEKKLNGIEIISPDKAFSYKEPILISSFRFKDEIYVYIKRKKLTNKIITF